MPAEQHRRAHQHEQRRPQCHQHGVVQQVEGPHAAAHLAHGGASEAVGMPVGREALHAPKGVLRHFAHHAQGEAHDGLEQHVAQGDQGQAEADDGRQCDQRIAHGTVARPCRRGHGVDHLAGEQRQGELGSGHQRDDARHEERQAPLLAPAAGSEAEGPQERVPRARGIARSHWLDATPCRGDGSSKDRTAERQNEAR